MNETRLPASAERDSEASHAMLDRLQQIIELAAVVLPVQGPLNVFIAQNKLQAFEKYPFDEGLRRAAATMGCHPYLSEERYREELRRARIRFSDLQEVLERDLGLKGTELIADRLTRYDLRLAMLEYPAKIAPTAELLWYIAETNALTRIRGDAPATLREQLIGETRRWVMRDLRSWNDNGNKQEPKWRVGNGLGELLERLGDSAIENWNDDRWEEFSLRALWRICIDGVSDLPPFTIPQLPTVRHRDLLAEATGQDSDRLVNEVLIRFCSAFLDQGLARWPLPNRDQGMYKAFCSLYGEGSAAPTRWMRGLSQELTRLSKNHVSPRESIRESLEILGIEEDEHEAFLSATLLALRGWAGMIWYVENRQDSAVKPVPKGSLVEFVAVRLLLDRFALKSLAAETIDYHGELSNLRSEARAKIVTQWPPTDEQRGFLVFQYAQILGLSPEILFGFDRDRWASLMSEIETFSSMERRRIFHSAFEQMFRVRTLDAIALHSSHEHKITSRPRFQATFCLDDREESFRRHLEEIAPDVETFGAAGFFNVVMYYKGAADAHFTALCPIVVRPQHWVVEEVGSAMDKVSRLRARTRRVLGTASHKFHVGSRSAALGAVLTGALGVFASFPLVARILFPRVAARIRGSLAKFVRTPPMTHLHLERTDPVAGPTGDHAGFNLTEMSASSERLLREIGLVKNFARLILVVGHRSNSQNNPYNSAYNCGACGGGNGGANGRAMAQILNDPRVRRNLSEHGLEIPAETVFVGGVHNTCDDSVTFFDITRIPESHRDDFAEAQRNIEEACARNAHERCRRFMSLRGIWL